MKLFDLRTPFFLPLWRRMATVAVALGWAAFELATGSPFWALIFGGLGAYAFWEFFVRFDPANYREEDAS